MLVFLDTNIILDYIDAKRNSIFPDSSKIFELAGSNEITLCASALTFSNIAYILRKIEYSKLMQVFSDLRTIVSILPTNENSLDAAIKSEFSDFEDAIQFYTACQGGADIVITRNVDDFPDKSIRVMTPTSFLKLIGKQL